MSLDHGVGTSTLAQRVETKVRQSAYGRIRNLVVEEIHGLVVVSGQAPSRHAKQLASRSARAPVERLSGREDHDRVSGLNLRDRAI